MSFTTATNGNHADVIGGEINRLHAVKESIEKKIAALEAVRSFFGKPADSPVGIDQDPAPAYSPLNDAIENLRRSRSGSNPFASFPVDTIKSLSRAEAIREMARYNDGVVNVKQAAPVLHKAGLVEGGSAGVNQAYTTCAASKKHFRRTEPNTFELV